MKDEGKTKEQLINELVELRQKITELKAAEAERKQTEEALRESEDLTRQVIDTTPASIFVIDRDSKFILTNKYMADLRGTTYSH